MVEPALFLSLIKFVRKKGKYNNTPHMCPFTFRISHPEEDEEKGRRRKFLCLSLIPLPNVPSSIGASGMDLFETTWPAFYHILLPSSM